MEINTAVWGTPDTWQQDTTFQNTSTMPDDYKFYRGQYPLISDYLDAKKLKIGEDIDYSMCYSAHGENMPMASLLAVATVQSGESSNRLEIVNCGASSAGWFFASSIGQASQAFFINGARIIFEDRPGSWDEISDYYWKPKGTRPVSGNAQASERISPIVKFNPHGCYMAIRVRIMNQRTGAFTVLTLAALEAAIEDYQDDYVIVQAWADLYARRGINTDTDYVPVLSNNNYDTGICPNSDFVVGGIDFQKYSMFLQCGMPLFGFNAGGNPSQKTFANYKDPLLHIPYVRPFYSTTASASQGYLFFATLPYTQADPYDNSLGFCYGIWADITEDNCEQLRKCAASYGLFFTDKAGSDYANDTERWTDEDMCLGILDSDGIGHGDYTRGILNTTNPIFDWTSNTDSNYDPSKDIDPNQYDNTTVFKMITGSVTGTKRYAMSAIAVSTLLTDLWDITAVMQQDGYENFTGKVQAGFLTQNPIDSIVSLQRYPFQPNHSSAAENIKLGRFTGNSTGFPISEAIETINFAGKHIFPRFGNCFLDYEPYTKYEIYVPFCGTISLSAADIIGHTLNVKLIVDMYTGTCTGYILADSLCIETVTGTVGVSLPISGLDAATINANIVRANINYQSAVSAETGALGSALSIGGIKSTVLNPVGFLDKMTQAGLQTNLAEYELGHIQAPPHKIGSSSPLTGWCMDTNARIIIYYPEGDVISNAIPPALIPDRIESFGKLQGFSTVSIGKVSEFSGFTAGTLRAEGIPCTEGERSRLKTLFENGVILP